MDRGERFLVATIARSAARGNDVADGGSVPAAANTRQSVRSAVVARGVAHPAGRRIAATRAPDDSAAVAQAVAVASAQVDAVLDALAKLPEPTLAQSAQVKSRPESHASATGAVPMVRARAAANLAVAANVSSTAAAPLAVHAAAAPLAIEELHDRAAIAALRPAWEALAADMAAAGETRGPFLSPDWFAIYAASLTERHDDARVGDLRLLVVHRGGKLAAALPLIAERRRLAGVPARVLRSLTDDHSQRFDVLLAPGAEGDAAARALVAHLGRRRDWDAVELQSVLARGAAADRLVAAARAAGWTDGEWTSMQSPFLPLPQTSDALDQQLGAKFRGNLRRRAKKLAAEVGAVALERVDGRDLDAAALHLLLDEGFALEAAGWKGELGTAIACDAKLNRHYRALAHAFARRGQLACYFLTVGGRRVAFHFALVDDHTYYLLKPGFDPQLSSYGLGHLLVDAVARDLITRNIRELDFLGDDMPWKRDWTDQLRPQLCRYLFAPTLRGRALAAWKLRIAPTLKQLIPVARTLWSRLHRS